MIAAANSNSVGFCSGHAMGDSVLYHSQLELAAAERFRALLSEIGHIQAPSSAATKAFVRIYPHATLNVQ